MVKELYYVTGNQGKFEEVDDFFTKQHLNFQVKHCALDIEEIQSLDQKVVVTDKVKKAFAQIKQPLLLDDGGIFFEAYPHFPGTLTKFIFRSLGFKGIFKLVEENAKAAFILQLAYIDATQIQLFEGICQGTLVHPPQTEPGHPQLPFTAIFKPNGSDKTLAQLRYTPEFSQYSFRQQALQKFITWYTMEKC